MGHIGRFFFENYQVLSDYLVWFGLKAEIQVRILLISNIESTNVANFTKSLQAKWLVGRFGFMCFVQSMCGRITSTHNEHIQSVIKPIKQYHQDLL